MKQLVCVFFLGLLVAHEANAQTSAADNKVQESITFEDPPRGRDIYGVFEGRTPCDISRQLGDPQPDCDHLKWQVLFYKDTMTQQPATYMLRTELFGRRPLKGAWRVVRGMKDDPDAVVYALDYGTNKVLYLFKGDDNVLFILDEERAFLVGDKEWSYTLNRVQKIRRQPPGN
jgi:hypothetical protein